MLRVSVHSYGGGGGGGDAGETDECGGVRLLKLVKLAAEGGGGGTEVDDADRKSPMHRTMQMMKSNTQNAAIIAAAHPRPKAVDNAVRWR